MIKYKKADARSRKGMSFLAEEALGNRLYVNGWLLQGQLGDFCRVYMGGQAGDSIAVAYDGKKPIGVCVMFNGKHRRGPMSMTFVRVAYRREGIGEQLVKTALGSRRKFRYNIGKKPVAPFFDKFKNGHCGW